MVTFDAPTFNAPPVDALTYGGMVLLVALVAIGGVLVFAGPNARRRLAWALGYVVIMCASAVAALSGALRAEHAFPPPVGVLLFTVVGGSLLLGLSPQGARAAKEASARDLVLLQVFRLPLELLMHHAAVQGIMPVELSFRGYNFDIVTGISAALLSLVFWRRSAARWLLWSWNVWGLGCLTAIAVIAVASSPMVHAFGTTPAHINSWVLYFPYVWLPAILVSTAVFSHVVLTRQLLSARVGRRTGGSTNSPDAAL